MKEKTKNILKGVGVGALACFGLFAMTGCSIDLSQEQVDKIMYTVDNSDKFMQDTLDLLEKQNNQLDMEQAWNLYKLAQTKLLLNDEKIMDNMKVSMELVDPNGEVEINNMFYYKTSTTERVLVNVGDDWHGVNYVENGFLYDYSYDANHGTHKHQLAEVSSDESVLMGTELPYANYIECDQEDMVTCNVLDNGNYEITFISTWTDDPDNYLQFDLVKVEITQDAKFVSEKIVTATQLLETEYRETSYFISVGKTTVTYEYGVVTDGDVLELLEEAKAASITPTE